ncbi:cyclic GMP-AMP synthase-like [Orbicella faveolata]|uniref:cyclic GMP-AMP synthase-like n=1 Tax=Orbicella faveolata TaxID=48498 RepID=UPI0009E37C8E|nr:cyclic GMP-AMP synthase-like [Orbicella faveolata]
MLRAKKLVKDYVEDEVIPYCKRNSPLPLLRLEYTGSMYEGLKCEAADEADLMVVLDTTDLEVVLEDVSEVPGYAKIKEDINSTPLRRYVDPWGYIIPAQIRLAWFYSLVTKAKNAFELKLPLSPVCLRVSSHGPAVKLDIILDATGAKKTLLSVDLVLCFQIGSSDYYVAKPYEGRRPVSDAELLWRPSFSLREKKVLKKIDKEDGCRRELLRIVKTILKKETTFAGLTSYHLKTAFMHYMTDTTENWPGDRSLEEHFPGFLGKLQSYLTDRQLPNYWQPRMNLLKDLNQKVLEHMASRLAKMKNLLSSKDGVQPSSFHTKITIKPLEKIGNYSGEVENGA